MTPPITIGVPSYSGGADLLPWCLQGIRDRTGDAIPYDLVVVDDSGKEEHQELTRAAADRFGARWLCHDRNRGITAAWNTLSRSSDATLVALLNDDIIVTPGWLEALAYFLCENPNAGSVGLGFFFITAEDVPQLLKSPMAKVTPRHHATKIHLPESEYSKRGTETPGCVMCPPGCAFGFSRQKYELVGGFAPETRSFYNESWFGTALAAAGHPSYVVPYPVLWHIWSATFQRSGHELLADDPMTKDRAAYKVHFGGDFDYTDPKFMAPFRGEANKHTVRWLGPNGPRYTQVCA